MGNVSGACLNRRVVVTGMGGLTSLGDSYAAIDVSLRAGISGVRTMPEWDVYDDLQTRLGAPRAISNS